MTDEIFNQIMAVRDTGAVNMFDVRGVSELCDTLDFPELQDYLAKSANEYSHFILTGERPTATI